MIVTDTDHDFAANGWANISIGSRRWRVPTGPGYPEDPNIPPSAPQVRLSLFCFFLLRFLRFLRFSNIT